MKPGRELDALVAEKVMGWKFTGGFSTDPELGSDRWATDSNGHERFYQDVPYYSTDIAAAWEVVEILSDRFDFRVHTRAGYTGKWVAFGYNPQKSKEMQEGDFQYGVFKSSLPHAICLAALKTVGVDVKNNTD